MTKIFISNRYCYHRFGFYGKSYFGIYLHLRRIGQCPYNKFEVAPRPTTGPRTTNEECEKRLCYFFFLVIHHSLLIFAFQHETCLDASYQVECFNSAITECCSSESCRLDVRKPWGWISDTRRSEHGDCSVRC